MTVHRSLKASGGMSKHRNVLTRVERMLKLEKDDRWKSATGSVLGLPKTKVPKQVGKKKKKAVAKEDAAGAPAAGAGATPTAGGTSSPGAAGAAKPAAKPAAGGAAKPAAKPAK